MGTGYTRQSAAEIAPDEIITAADLEAEFDAIEAFASGTLGHTHDGTTGEGPAISLATSITGILPVANGGIAAIHKINGGTAPTINEDSNDNYGPGSIWIDIVADTAYVCVDATVGAAVWKSLQFTDAELTALAGLTSAADKVPYFTGSGTAAVADFTAYGRAIVASASEAAFKSGVNLEIGTDVQAYSANLTGWSAVQVADYYTALEADGLFQPLDAQLTLWADVTPASYLTTAAAAAAYQPLDSDLTAIAAVSPSNDDILQRKAGAWTNRTMAQLATDLSLAATYQPLDADLTAIAALTTNAAGRGLLTLSDSGADTIVFWDDSAGAFTHLTVSTGLTITTTSIALSAGAQASLALADSALQAAAIGVTVQGYDVDTCKLDVADQVVTGGVRITSLSDGTKSSGTYTPDPGDRPMIHITNGGAFTLAPGSNNGFYLLDITNNASAGAITTSGWTKVTGDAFTTTNGNIFRCSCSIGNGGSLLSVTAMQ